MFAKKENLNLSSFFIFLLKHWIKKKSINYHNMKTHGSFFNYFRNYLLRLFLARNLKFSNLSSNNLWTWPGCQLCDSLFLLCHFFIQTSPLLLQRVLLFLQLFLKPETQTVIFSVVHTFTEYVFLKFNAWEIKTSFLFYIQGLEGWI